MSKLKHSDTQIRDDLCAVLYDEDKCKRSEDFLELRSGDQGVLPLLTTGLRRNDVEVVSTLELSTGLREMSKCPSKAPTWTFSLLKAPTSSFTIKNLLKTLFQIGI